MKILIDFDDVILNSKKFKEDYRKIFKKHGIPELVSIKHYYDKRESEKDIKAYDPEKHLNNIKRIEKIDVSKLRGEAMAFPQNSNKYLHADFKDFAKSFRKKDIIIITFTNTCFQRNKVKYCGVLKYVSRCIFTGKLKSEAVGKIYGTKKITDGDKVYFIDDRVKQIESVKKKYPKIVTILMKRKNGSYFDDKTKYCDYVAKDLRGAYKIIKKTSK
jgi:FMN phosphatase YigB (HAD superfamily)